MATCCIRAQVIRWVSDDFPGFMECTFTDRLSREWFVIEKLPVLITADIRYGSELPQAVSIPCEIVARGRDDAGREIVEVTTMAPWSIEATDGTSSFQVYADQLQIRDH
jgi:hypothetical protein